MKRKIAFNEHNVYTERKLMKEVRSDIKKAKIRYKDKIEAELSNSDLKEAYNGIKTKN